MTPVKKLAVSCMAAVSCWMASPQGMINSVEAGGFKKSKSACVSCESVPICPECSSCQPSTSAAPESTPSTTSPDSAPSAEGAVPPANEPGQDFNQNISDAMNAEISSSPLAAAGPQGNAPAMIGDFFGTSTGGILTTQVPGLFNGVVGTATFSNGFIYPDPTVGQPILFNTPTGTVVVTFSPPIVQPITQVSPGITGQPSAQNFNGTLGSTIPLSTSSLTNQQVTAQVQAIGVPLIQGYEVANNPYGVPLAAAPQVTIAEDGAEAVENGEHYDLNYSYVAQSILTLATPIELSLPNPSGGGVVGRMKIAENNSPLPRDRVFFNFNYFQNVPFTAGGIDVKRYCLGAEKTFFDQMTSVEFRFPFATTYNSDQAFASAPAYNNVEIGNLNMNLKALLYQTGTFAFTAGTGIGIPTADDVRAQDFQGGTVVLINNQAYHFLPYLGALWTPTNRFFAQGFVQCDFATNGNSVYSSLSNPIGVVGLQRRGVITDQTPLYVDLGAGYWVYQNYASDATISGIAAIGELHYTSTMGNVDRVVDGGVVIGDFAGNVDMLNLTVGVNMEILQRTNVIVAAGLPLKDGINGRQFDFELQAQLVHRFGPQTRASRVNF